MLLLKIRHGDLLLCPPNINVIRTMWIFSHNEKFDGSFERHESPLKDDCVGQHVGVE